MNWTDWTDVTYGTFWTNRIFIFQTVLPYPISFVRPGLT